MSNNQSQRFHHETDIMVAYSAAEYVVMSLVQREVILLVDNREPEKARVIRSIARAVADAVIRTDGVEEDITDMPDVTIERV